MKITIRRFVLIHFLFCLQVFIGKTYSQVSWENVTIGGGGYVTGLVIHPKVPDLMYIRTDVGGCYRWNPENGKWIPLSDRIDYIKRAFFHIDGIALDPNDANVVYVTCGDDGEEPVIVPKVSDMMKSADRGETWTSTGLKLEFFGNNEQRWYGEPIAVDPENSDVIVVGSRNQGLYRTKDGCKSWQKVGSVPNGTKNIGIRCVLYDSTSHLIKGRTSIVYAGVWDGGVYQSKDGGESFLLIEGSPVQPRRMAITTSGQLVLTHENGVAIYDGKSWKDITPNDVKGEPFCGVSTDASGSGKLIVSMDQTRRNGKFFVDNLPIYRTRDNGGTWEKITKSQNWSTAPAWFKNPGFFQDALASLQMDPHHPGRVYSTDWFSIWYTNDIWAENTTWLNIPRGHEETYVFQLASPPAGDARLFVCSPDVSGFRVTDPGQYPENCFSRTYNETTSVSNCIQNNNYIAVVGASGWGGSSTHVGFSNNNGTSFVYRDPPTGALSGKIAYSASDTNNLVYCPGSLEPYFTQDQGVTWQKCEGFTSSQIRIAKNIWDWTEGVTADAIDGKVFYIFLDGDLYKSINGGASFQKTAGSNELPHAGGLAHMKASPIKTGVLAITIEDQGLWLTTDGGGSLSRITGFTDAVCCGWGASSGNGHASLYVFGKMTTEYGLFLSNDNGNTWKELSTDTQRLGKTSVVEGDKREYGRVYVGSKGRGVMMGVLLERTD